MTTPRFSGYYFKIVADIEWLMSLSDSELRMYILAQYSIQRERNAGQLAIRLMARRANRAKRTVENAIASLCENGALETEKVAGRTTVYRNPFEWRKKATVEVAAEVGRDCPTQVGHHCPTPVGQHSENITREEEKKEEQRTVICAPPPQPPKPPATQNPDVRTRNLLRPDDERPKTYASPKDELIAICRRHVPQPPTIAGWDRVELVLATSGVSVTDFVARVRSEIISGKIKIADAFLLTKAREFSRTVEIRPVEAAPERCPICKEIKGRGTLYPKMPDGSVRYVACECATPEWRRKVEAMQVEALARARSAQEARGMAMLA